MLGKFENMFITEASNGDEALNLLDVYQISDTKKFHFMFIDLSMPILDGQQTTQIVRNRIEKQKYKPLIIILMTAYREEECYDQVNVDFDEICVKPISYEFLVKIFDKYIKQE